VNRVNRAYEDGGIEAFWDELEKLDDVVRALTVASAFFPDLIREVIKDQMAEHGVTVEDLREILRKPDPLSIDLSKRLAGPFFFSAAGTRLLFSLIRANQSSCPAT
jgi:hypothetical protein